MKKPGSLLKVKDFSESEPEEDQEENEKDEEMEADQSNAEAEKLLPSSSKLKAQKKIGKKGIIYISNIPKHMNVAICRELMESFGEVGRIFLQPDSKGSKLFVLRHRHDHRYGLS